MINILVHENNQYPVRKLLSTSRGAFPYLRLVTYQDAFRTLSFPQGTMLFTDFDYLDSVEIEAAANMARAALAADPDTRILNHPCYACERFELLRRLEAQGISSIEVIRLDNGAMPTRYPVFIRSEDRAGGPETGLLENEAAFLGAIADLRASGKPVKRRICVSYEGEADEHGHFRKFGAFRIGEHIVPQHMLYNRDWVVKSASGEHAERFVAEELAYVRDNPHRDLVTKAFDAGDLQFGRIDYAFKQGAPVVFEINPNPTFPRFDHGVRPDRRERSEIIFERLRMALADIDQPGAARARIKFAAPEPSSKFLETGYWSPWTRWLWHRRQESRMRRESD